MTMTISKHDGQTMTTAWWGWMASDTGTYKCEDGFAVLSNFSYSCYMAFVRFLLQVKNAECNIVLPFLSICLSVECWYRIQMNERLVKLGMGIIPVLFTTTAITKLHKNPFRGGEWGGQENVRYSTENAGYLSMICLRLLWNTSR